MILELGNSPHTTALWMEREAEGTILRGKGEREREKIRLAEEIRIQIEKDSFWLCWF